MARTASGFEVLEEAKRLLSRARAAEELRQAQAVVLPLEFGVKDLTLFPAVIVSN